MNWYFGLIYTASHIDVMHDATRPWAVVAISDAGRIGHVYSRHTTKASARKAVSKLNREEI